jgi:hypothetical protein
VPNRHKINELFFHKIESNILNELWKEFISEKKWPLDITVRCVIFIKLMCQDSLRSVAKK